MRNEFEASPLAYKCGDVGRLQTDMVMLTLPGDLIEIDALSLYRLSTLRKPLSMDPYVDRMVVWTPLRHCWDNWVDMIKEGVDSTETLASVNVPVSPYIQNGAYANYTIGHLGYDVTHNTTYPRWIFTWYNQFWNWYMRHKKLTTTKIPDTYTSFDGIPTGHSGKSRIGTSIKQVMFGYNCARKKEAWNTGIIESELTNSDYELASTSVVDIIEFKKLQARLKTEVLRDYEAPEYIDIIDKTWNTKISNIEIDERPALIQRQEFTLSGHDVIGTADQNFGNVAGKANGIKPFHMPRRRFTEHGVLAIVNLLRFDAVVQGEIPRLWKTAAPTYTEIAGDPNIMMMEKPEDAQTQHWFDQGNTTSLGKIPAGQQYRTVPNAIHPLYHHVSGLPFLKHSSINSHVNAVYSDSSDYDHMFHDQQLGQYQCQSAYNIRMIRNYPVAGASVYAGTK